MTIYENKLISYLRKENHMKDLTIISINLSTYIVSYIIILFGHFL